MAGKKGMLHRKAKPDTLREKAWRSIRILRSFSIDTVLVSSVMEPTDSDYENLTKWFRHLLKHGVIRKVGAAVFRRAGEHQVYALVRDTPARPLYCDVCGQSLSSRICDPSLLKKETKKKRKKETETEKQEICGCEDLCHAHENKADEKVEVDHE